MKYLLSDPKLAAPPLTRSPRHASVRDNEGAGTLSAWTAAAGRPNGSSVEFQIAERWIGRNQLA
jgi:hypothetical protein